MTGVGIRSGGLGVLSTDERVREVSGTAVRCKRSLLEDVSCGSMLRESLVVLKDDIFDGDIIGVKCEN